MPWSSSEKCKQADNRLLLFSFGDACQGTERIGVSTRMRRRSTPYQPPLRLVGCGRLGNGQALSPCATVHEVPRDVESANAEWPDRGTTTGITDAARAGNIGGSVVPNAMHNDRVARTRRAKRTSGPRILLLEGTTPCLSRYALMNSGATFSSQFYKPYQWKDPAPLIAPRIL